MQLVSTVTVFFRIRDLRANAGTSITATAEPSPSGSATGSKRPAGAADFRASMPKRKPKKHKKKFPQYEYNSDSDFE